MLRNAAVSEISVANMTYQEFLGTAQPAGFVAAVAKLGAIRRGITWIGIRVGFVLFRFRLSANQVSLAGWLCGICGLILVCLAGQLPRWSGGIAVACCYASAFADFCDGSVARASRRADKLGGIFDGITTDFMRAGLLVVMGVVAGSTAFVVIGLVSGYIIVPIRNQFIWSGLLSSFSRQGNRWTTSMFHWAFSVHVMIGVIPLIFAVAAFFGEFPIVARVLLALYLLLSLAWFWLASSSVRRQTAETLASGEEGAH